jgi:hypothetical protein
VRPKKSFELRSIALDPSPASPDGYMIDRQAPLPHQIFHVATGIREAQIPAHRHKHHLRVKLPPFESPLALVWSLHHPTSTGLGEVATVPFSRLAATARPPAPPRASARQLAAHFTPAAQEVVNPPLVAGVRHRGRCAGAQLSDRRLHQATIGGVHNDKVMIRTKTRDTSKWSGCISGSASMQY